MTFFSWPTDFGVLRRKELRLLTDLSESGFHCFGPEMQASQCAGIIKTERGLQIEAMLQCSLSTAVDEHLATTQWAIGLTSGAHETALLRLVKSIVPQIDCKTL
jgi:hypothetical protein